MTTESVSVLYSISYEMRKKTVVIILHRIKVANKYDIRRAQAKEDTFNKGKMNYLRFYLI